MLIHKNSNPQTATFSYQQSQSQNSQFPLAARKMFNGLKDDDRHAQSSKDSRSTTSQIHEAIPTGQHARLGVAEGIDAVTDRDSSSGLAITARSEKCTHKIPESGRYRSHINIVNLQLTSGLFPSPPPPPRQDHPAVSLCILIRHC